MTYTTTRNALAALSLLLVIVAVGCQGGGPFSPASPWTTVENNVTNIFHGDMHGNVGTDYQKESTTGIESVLEQQLEDMLNPDVEIPIGPLSHEEPRPIYDNARSSKVAPVPGMGAALRSALYGPERPHSPRPVDIPLRLRERAPPDTSPLLLAPEDPLRRSSARLPLPRSQIEPAVG